MKNQLQLAWVGVKNPDVFVVREFDGKLVAPLLPLLPTLLSIRTYRVL
jgi:hypothetical protein